METKSTTQILCESSSFHGASTSSSSKNAIKQNLTKWTSTKLNQQIINLDNGHGNGSFMNNNKLKSDYSNHNNIVSNDNDEDDGCDDGDGAESLTSESSSSKDEGWNNEIPIWVRGEQRWISGVTDQTTCYNLIEALLSDEGTFGKIGTVCQPNEFVIIERWRKVEQVLDGEARIWKIWCAWGEAQTDVRLSLHCTAIETNRRNNVHVNVEGDSGRDSPTGSINSAIERRRRHRASKSTSAWLTHAQTIHPKSQKSTIEKLMKLILEQGETIQQQLSKLRDKEMQISRIEEERHKIREKEHGKNYLLETYLKGLHEAEDKEAMNTHSDSGINTEDTTPLTVSPDIGNPCSSSSLSPNMNEASDNKEPDITYVRKKSRREQNLIKDHDEYKKELNNEAESTSSGGGGGCSTSQIGDEDSTTSQIEMLEKLVSLNKKLQHEEELLLRLTVKIRRYEYENPSLTEDEIQQEINRINTEIKQSNSETQKTEKQIQIYDEILKMKSNFLDQLIDEVEQSDTLSNSEEIQPPPIPPPPKLLLMEQHHQLVLPNLSNNPNRIKFTKDETTTKFIRHTPELALINENDEYFGSVLSPPPQFSNIAEVQIHSIPKSQLEQKPFFSKSILKTSSSSLSTAPHHNPNQSYPTFGNGIPSHISPCLNANLNTTNGINGKNFNNKILLANSYEFLEKSHHTPADNQRKPTVSVNNFYVNSNLKLGPKKMLLVGGDTHQNINMSNNLNCLNGLVNSGGCEGGSVASGGCDSNSSDTGVSSMGEGDMSQLGTLV